MAEEANDDKLTGQELLRLGAVAVGAFGFVITARHLWKQGVPAMDGMQIVMIAVLIVVGYALGRLWATPAKLVGLP